MPVTDDELKETPYITFPRLLASDKRPQCVGDAVNRQVPRPPDEEVDSDGFDDISDWDRPSQAPEYDREDWVAPRGSTCSDRHT